MFDEFGPEEEQEIRELQVDRSPALEEMLTNLKEIMKIHSNELVAYETIEDKAPREYTARDVERFSQLLRIFPNPDTLVEKLTFSHHAGMYLSVLINKCRDDKFIIHCHNYNLNDLGHKNNGKHIIVKGNVGINLGRDMINGSIHLYGNAISSVGAHMRGGKIVVYRDAGEMTGVMMHGGEIDLKGNYRYDLGIGMHGGNIYHKGIQIVKNGKRIG